MPFVYLPFSVLFFYLMSTLVRLSLYRHLPCFLMCRYPFKFSRWSNDLLLGKRGDLQEEKVAQASDFLTSVTSVTFKAWGEGGTHCKEDSIYGFPEMKLRGLVPNFHFMYL
jgi:hypothetical protein